VDRSAELESVAAVDLGSNSFHMVVARVVDGRPQVVDRLRERVALAEGLDDDQRLRPKFQERALACLERFGQRLAHLPRGSVRAVGTNTLRRARDTRAFLARAEAALGHPIEVISGREEARLIYLGVSHAHTDDARRRLVVDIGGGSTELILGEGAEPLETDSLQMGCVSYSLRYFDGGAVGRDAFRRAQIAAALELEGLARRYKHRGWQSCVGSSGTIVAAEEIVRLAGWTAGGITPKALRKLRRAMLEAGRVEALDLPGLQDDRRPVLAGGVAILSAVFKILGIESMRASPGAMREGVLHDLLGRLRHEDVREHTIRRFAARYHVDVRQARRVERTALVLLERVRDEWELDGEALERALSWAARLHEIGLSIAYSGYHKHGAYIAANADMPGFSRDDQRLLSVLILNHRRKPSLESFEALPAESAGTARRLCVLLRLAVHVHRARAPRVHLPFRIRARKDAVQLDFDRGWLDTHPLTRADLEGEVDDLNSLGFGLELS
jgi:exopolyphosphatase/guanosine-5'-triphosphate,3'-diphosphate pyrophosphatase